MRINHAGEKPTPGSGQGGRAGGRGGRSDRGGFSNNTPSKTLFVRNLSYNATEDSIRKMFKAAYNVSLPVTEDGSLKGLASLSLGFYDDTHDMLILIGLVSLTLRMKQRLSLHSRG